MSPKNRYLFFNQEIIFQFDRFRGAFQKWDFLILRIRKTKCSKKVSVRKAFSIQRVSCFKELFASRSFSLRRTFRFEQLFDSKKLLLQRPFFRFRELFTP